VPDPLAGPRARLKEVQETIAALANLVDPVVAAAWEKLILKRNGLEVQLRSSLPLRTQLKSATAKLQRGLATVAAVHAEVVQLELVLKSGGRGGEGLHRRRRCTA